MKGEKEMTIKQISVFLENKPGKLAEFVEVLRGHGIDMRALSLAEASDFGIARVIVDDPDKTQQVLAEAHFISSVTPVLAVAVSDQPGALYEMLEAMREGSVNIEYTYAFTTRRIHLRLHDAHRQRRVHGLPRRGQIHRRRREAPRKAQHQNRRSGRYIQAVKHAPPRLAQRRGLFV